MMNRSMDQSKEEKAILEALLLSEKKSSVFGRAAKRFKSTSHGL